MQYDPIKDRLGAFFARRAGLQRLFYRMLDVLFLRSWHVRREIKKLYGDRREEPLRILDAGTGFGQYAYFLARYFRKSSILAIDIKEVYLDRAKAFFNTTPFGSRVVFEHDDLTALNAEGPFDCILSVDVMEHIEEDERVFRHFERVLREGGYVIINTPSDRGGSGVETKEDVSFIEEHVREGYNRKVLKAKLKRAGLQPVRARYTYGKAGQAAWKLLIKWPILWVNRSWWFLPAVAAYYVVVFPAAMALHFVDTHVEHASGTGLLVVACKPSAVAERT